MTDYEALIFEQMDGIARITLNRPDAANAMNPTMSRELMLAALRCDADPAVRAVLITGSGRAFCAGGDLRHFIEAGDDAPRMLKELTTYLHAAISRFARCGKPVVAGVNGVAAGAGFSLAIACDVAVAAASARFTAAYTRAGLTPDGSMSYYLPRIVGSRRATELIYTNRVLSAQEALEWGVVNEVADDEGFGDAALALARTLAEGPTQAFGRAKELLRTTWTESLEAQMENETQAIAASARTADYREGTAAFIEKRAPKFSGM